MNEVNTSNLRQIVRNLFKNNIIRAHGLLARAIIEAQNNLPNNTNVYAALIAIINTEFPQISLLICKRVISFYRDSFLADERKKCFSLLKFISYLINQKLVCIFLVLMNKTILILFSIFLFSCIKRLHFKYLMFFFAILVVIVLN